MRWYNLDIEKSLYEQKHIKKYNFPAGGLVWVAGYVNAFEFPDLLQDSDFYLQRYDVETDTWTYVMQLDNSQKSNNSFLAYENDSVTAGYYRLRAGNYVSEVFSVANDDLQLFSDYVATADNQLVKTDNDFVITAINFEL